MPDIEVNGVSLYYEAAGDGHPLVFIHGGALDCTSWHFQTTFFSEKYRVITYDIRGHGRTEVPEGSYFMDDYVEDLKQLLDHLAIGRTYLAGLSMGGYIALNFTLCHPERVDALILTGSNSGPLIEAVAIKGDEAAARIRLTGRRAFAEKFVRAQEANLARPDLTGRLSEISQPVLIMVGDKDASTPLYISEDMHSRIANSQMVVFHSCGHLCNKEQPDTFNSIVKDFLQGVEAT